MVCLSLSDIMHINWAFYWSLLTLIIDTQFPTHEELKVWNWYLLFVTILTLYPNFSYNFKWCMNWTSWHEAIGCTTKYDMNWDCRLYSNIQSLNNQVYLISLYLMWMYNLWTFGAKFFDSVTKKLWSVVVQWTVKKKEIPFRKKKKIEK